MDDPDLFMRPKRPRPTPEQLRRARELAAERRFQRDCRLTKLWVRWHVRPCEGSVVRLRDAECACQRWALRSGYAPPSPPRIRGALMYLYCESTDRAGEAVFRGVRLLRQGDDA